MVASVGRATSQMRSMIMSRLLLGDHDDHDDDFYDFLMIFMILMMMMSKVMSRLHLR